VTALCHHCKHQIILPGDVPGRGEVVVSVDCAHCGASYPWPVAPSDATNIAGIPLDELLARGLNTVPPLGEERWEPPTPEQLSCLLPQYQIESFLGRGGMGAVYKGHQERLQRPVAIKLLPRELADDLNFVARFEREARTLAKLDHPGIISVYDFGHTFEGHLFFVMEFVDGTDLHRLISDTGIDPQRALEIIGQVCEALQFAHSVGVVHRDIKPANILVTRDGRVKLADFGLARPLAADLGGRLTLSRVVMGTPDYMAPEQKQGQGDHRVDLYALGVMLYEMLCGKPPQGAWQPPSQRVCVDVRLDQVVIKAMQEEPELRYQQAMQVKSDLDAIRSSSIDQSSTISRPPTSEPGRSEEEASPHTNRSKWILAASACLLILAAFGLWKETSKLERLSKTTEDEHQISRSDLNEATKPEYRTLISADFDGSSPFSEKKSQTLETFRENGFYKVRRRDSGCLWLGAAGSEAGSSTLIRIRARISKEGIYEGAAHTASWAINCRCNQRGSYKVEIRGDGFWRLHYLKFYEIKGSSHPVKEFDSISPWQSSPGVHSAGQFNDVTVTAKGSHFVIVINGIQLCEFDHEGSKSGGYNLMFCSQGEALLECDYFELLEEVHPSIVKNAINTTASTESVAPFKKDPSGAVVTEGEIVDSLHIKYRLNKDSTAHVVGYVAEVETLNIPATVNGIPVTAIADSAFESNTKLRRVTIAGGIEKIGSFSFKGCSQLEDIQLPPSLKVIGPWAFDSCMNLNQPVFPDGVTRIGEGAFSNCSKIRTFVSPPALRFLERYSFQNCIEIREVTIPETVERMEGGVFAGCIGIKEFKVAEDHPAFAAVDGVLFDRSLGKLVHFPPGRAGSYGVPATTRVIGHRAFYGCFDLQAITLPDRLKTIETQSFIQCNSLETVEIPASVDLVMDGAFSNCERLQAVRITSPHTVVDPEQVEKLGSKLILPHR